MAENLMTSDHKATKPAFRENYDKITWGSKRKGIKPVKVNGKILKKFVKHSGELD
jgi:hypothetical protein